MPRLAQLQSNEEVASFIKYTIALARYHTQVGQMVGTVSDPSRTARLAGIRAGAAARCLICCCLFHGTAAAACIRYERIFYPLTAHLVHTICST